MKFLVCRNKDDNSLFITTRSARETMIGAMQQIKQEIPSVVLKAFDTHKEAREYQKQQDAADKVITNTLNKKQ